MYKEKVVKQVAKKSEERCATERKAINEILHELKLRKVSYLNKKTP